MAVGIFPGQTRYWEGQSVRICARVARGGELVFTNRKTSGAVYAILTTDVSGGRQYCFDGAVEWNDRCVGALLRTYAGTFSAREVCFEVR